jgi:hypothetical protein
MSFEEISDLVPVTSHRAPTGTTWWNNEDDPSSTHSQGRLGWMAATKWSPIEPRDEATFTRSARSSPEKSLISRLPERR